MTTVREIEDALTRLPEQELEKFRAWFAAFDADSWDRQFEQDARRGALDALADEALDDLKAGRCKSL